MVTKKYILFLFIVVLFSAEQVQAQFIPTAVSIPMRDGKELAGDLYLPNESGSFPTILIQTPYSKSGFLLTGLPLGVNYDISQSDYAFLVVDWRCFFQSAEACVIGGNNGEDGHDVVEWIADQEWSDGKVGTWGPSALGSVQFQTAKEQPEHLVCAVPIVVSPQVAYEKYFQGGAARIDYMSFVGVYFGLQGLITANPYYNFLWEITENSTMYPEDIEVPMLIIGGWFDINSEDCLLMYDTLNSTSGIDVRDDHRLLMGPWSHSFVGVKKQGELEFPEAEAYDAIKAKQFFDYFLRGEENDWDVGPNIQYFQMGENEWKETAKWPPDNSIYVHYDLSSDSKLTQAMFQDFEMTETFEYDPEDPSPSIGGKVFGFDPFQLNVGPRDISDDVEGRNDNVIFSTDELSNNLNVQGKIKVKLFISSDRKDSDISLRLVDVYPDGRSIILSEAHRRLHMRNGFRLSDVDYLEPGEVYEVDLEFEHLAHTFLQGHQIRLVITSSNYPRFNRNMNTGEEMYPDSNIDTLVNPLVANNSIHFGGMYNSAIMLPVDESSVGIEEISKNLAVSIFPNPVTEYLNIHSNSRMSAIKIFDILGNVLYTKNEINSNFELIKAANFPAGTYLLKVEQENGKYSVSKFNKS